MFNHIFAGFHCQIIGLNDMDSDWYYILVGSFSEHHRETLISLLDLIKVLNSQNRSSSLF